MPLALGFRVRHLACLGLGARRGGACGRLGTPGLREVFRGFVVLARRRVIAFAVYILLVLLTALALEAARVARVLLVAPGLGALLTLLPAIAPLVALRITLLLRAPVALLTLLATVLPIVSLPALLCTHETSSLHRRPLAPARKESGSRHRTAFSWRHCAAAVAPAQSAQAGS